MIYSEQKINDKIFGVDEFESLFDTYCQSHVTSCIFVCSGPLGVALPRIDACFSDKNPLIELLSGIRPYTELPVPGRIEKAMPDRPNIGLLPDIHSIYNKD